jgi:hypothetical protein
VFNSRRSQRDQGKQIANGDSAPTRQRPASVQLDSPGHRGTSSGWGGAAGLAVRKIINFGSDRNMTSAPIPAPDPSDDRSRPRDSISIGLLARERVVSG